MHKMHHRLLASGFALLSVSIACMPVSWATQPIDLRHQPISFLNKLNTTLSFKQTNSSLDSNKTVHVRFQQFYKEYRVWTADGVMHIPNGMSNASALTQALQKPNNHMTMNGIVYDGLDIDLAHAPNYIFSKAHADKILEQTIQLYQKKSSNKNEIKNPTTKLMVYVDEESKAHWAFLINFVTYSAKKLPEKPNYIIDAINFTTYKHWNNIQTLEDVEGGGYGGNEKMGKLVYSNHSGSLPDMIMERDVSTKTCFLENADVTVKDRRNNDAVVHFACEKPTKLNSEFYWDGDFDAVNGGYSPSNDALYSGKVIKEMYQEWYGLPVLTENGKPMMLNMRVHEEMDNAYWDGQQMTFGDGISVFYPLVSLGVAAHEISHGFTEQHSGLVYDGQSGGLNESFSDMAAQAAEFYSANKNSWQIGPEIFKAKDEALRYMDEPTKDCRGQRPGSWCSISNVNDYYSGLDVHFSSGVFNKLFYLLATSKNWDTKKAFDVMVNANTHYWTSGTSFQDALCGVMSAAKDQHYETDAIANAASGVGLDSKKCS